MIRSRDQDKIVDQEIRSRDMIERYDQEIKRSSYL